MENASSVLDQIIQDGARRMLQAALENEVETFLERHSNKVDKEGRRQVVRNGYLPSRGLVTGAGTLEIQQPRVRDKSPEADDRVRFSSSILPPYLRRSKAIDELIPWLYLKGISTGDFSEALQSLTGAPMDSVSASTIVRLKEAWTKEYETWSCRDLSEKRYAYICADGIHVNVRLEDQENQRQCLLVVMGATAEGEKELIATRRLPLLREYASKRCSAPHERRWIGRFRRERLGRGTADGHPNRYRSVDYHPRRII
ncbi:transposase [Pirellulaceae bacterium SH501]